MTVPTSGAIRMSHLRAEFMPAGSNMPVALATFYRGSTYIKKNAVNNTAVNLAASVPEFGPIKFSDFRGTTKGWVATNIGTLTNKHMHNSFGNDWGVDWPKKYVNNGTIGATDINNYAFTIYSGAAGRIDFVNNGSIMGAGGVLSGNPGQHALRINCNVRVYVTNNFDIAGGGGAGGRGGQGGTGGSGFVSNLVYEGYPGIYDPGQYVYNTRPSTGQTTIRWNGENTLTLATGIGDTYLHTDGYTYYRDGYQGLIAGVNHYGVYRSSGSISYYAGAAGGAGGSGGRGRGYDGSGAAGSGGAPGGNAGNNTGTGGTGGTGGNGGGWGTAGSQGSAGGAGAPGNHSAGLTGAAGLPGGAAGYAIFVDSAWTNLATGTRYGPVGPTAATAG